MQIRLFCLVFDRERSASPVGCDAATCVVEFFIGSDGSTSVDSRVSYDIGGKIKHDIFDDDGLDELDRAVPDLHALLKEHTGGSWSVFSMMIDGDGKLTAEFDYPQTT